MQIIKHEHKGKAYEIPLNTMVENLPNEVYHSILGISSTQLEDLRSSIRLWENRYLFNERKDCFDIGNLAHDCFLLPHLVDEMYLESPTVGLDTIKAKKAREENPDKIIVGQGMIEDYKEKAKNLKVIFPLIANENVKKEVSFFWRHEESGLLFKARPDIYEPETGLHLDFKTTKEENIRGFERVIESLDYEMKLAFHNDVVRECGYKVNKELTGWICMPKTSPNKPFGITASQELLEKGRDKYNKEIQKYMKYKEQELMLGANDMKLILSDVFSKQAHSWEYRKENYIGDR